MKIEIDDEKYEEITNLLDLISTRLRQNNDINSGVGEYLLKSKNALQDASENQNRVAGNLVDSLHNLTLAVKENDDRRSKAEERAERNNERLIEALNRQSQALENQTAALNKNNELMEKILQQQISANSTQNAGQTSQKQSSSLSATLQQNATLEDKDFEQKVISLLAVSVRSKHDGRWAFSHNSEYPRPVYDANFKAVKDAVDKNPALRDRLFDLVENYSKNRENGVETDFEKAVLSERKKVLYFANRNNSQASGR